MGTIYGGHYVSYVKKEDDKWYCTNDERVGKVSKEEVL
jgi:ubiquitin C-terminal hydrolase